MECCVVLLVLFRIFLYQENVPQYSRYQVLISEIFPDPSPSVKLPAFEFVELTNVSSRATDLWGWSLSNGYSSITIRDHYLLAPDSMVVICSISAAKAYKDIPCMGVPGFISIDNISGRITLYDPDKQLVHSVGYNKSFYGNKSKSGGGWTLEMIDLSNPCGGIDNWAASSSSEGGSPGRKNSVAAYNPDIKPPELLRSYASDSSSLVAVFDESLDSMAASVPARYALTIGVRPEKAIPLAPAFNEVLLEFSAPLSHSAGTLTVNNVSDCSGNTIGRYNSCPAGLPSVPVKNDIVINEVLFNPKPDCQDYVEIFNRSKKIIDLSNIYLSGRSLSGSPVSPERLSPFPLLLFPGEYFAVSEDVADLPFCYHVMDMGRIAEISLPSLPDDKGSLMLTSGQGLIIDALDYDEDWHFPLLSNDEGVALERIDYNGPTQQKDNWMSASSSSGFGTPGYINSQYRSDLLPKGLVSISPVVFSPDNDGRDDFTTISYTMDRAGYMGSIIVFNDAGRKIRILVNNGLLGMNGFFRWDGLDENKMPLSPGIYLILIQVFNVQGRTKKFMKAVTLAKRF